MADTITVDLLSLIEQHAGISLPYAATTDGGEYTGPCPFCKTGKDRFHVWPHASEKYPKPHYWCRECKARGDAIQFLKDYEGMSYSDACNELGIDPGQGLYQGTPIPLLAGPAPCKEWQATAEEFVHSAQKALFANAGQHYFAYLMERGITTAMIQEKQIGYVPLGSDGRWREYPFERWGLTEDMLNEKDRKKGCVRVPDGLFFPHRGPDGKIWKLSMYRPLATVLPEFRRGQILGSKDCLLNEHLMAQFKDTPIAMTESFLDAISIEQVAGDLVIATSTDGTDRSRSLRCQAQLGYAPFVLQAFDNDAAGKEAAGWWTRTLDRCVRWMPANFVDTKDCNEMLQHNADDLRQWVMNGLSFASRNPPHPAGWQTPVEIATQQDDDSSELPGQCAICKAEVGSYTSQGTPCCSQHYQSQQKIEEAIAAEKQATQSSTQQYQEVLSSNQQDVDSIEHLAIMTSMIVDIVGPCEIYRDPSGYTIADRVKELRQQAQEAYLFRIAINARNKQTVTGVSSHA